MKQERRGEREREREDKAHNTLEEQKWRRKTERKGKFLLEKKDSFI